MDDNLNWWFYGLPGWSGISAGWPGLGISVAVKKNLFHSNKKIAVTLKFKLC